MEDVKSYIDITETIKSIDDDVYSILDDKEEKSDIYNTSCRVYD